MPKSTIYLYDIKVSKEELDKYYDYDCNAKRADYPYILNLKNKEKILIMHGSKEGYYYENANCPIEYTSTVINMYKNFFYDTPSKTIFTLSCYGGFMKTIYDPLDINIEPVIKSKNEIKIRYNYDKSCIEVMTLDKVIIPERLNKVIIFSGTRKEVF